MAGLKKAFVAVICVLFLLLEIKRSVAKWYIERIISSHHQVYYERGSLKHDLFNSASWWGRWGRQTMWQRGTRSVMCI